MHNNRFLLKKILTAVLFCLLLSEARAQQVFHWQWQLVNDSLRITGRLNTAAETVIQLPSTAFRQQATWLYQTVDEINYKDWKNYQQLIDSLSELVVKPFEKDLLQSERVAVVLDSGLLNIPIEWLKIRNSPLAVFRPMIFSIDGIGAKKIGADTIALRKGFILRDPTSDPEDACATTFHRYPSSTYRSTNRIKPENLSLKKDADFVLISAHGFADSATLKGCVFAGEAPIKPDVFRNTYLKLVYVDGCQQGINWSYIKAVAQNSTTTFYLGPIVSNDSGESSTKTINWFFSHLQQSGNPASALWQTRKQLLKHYTASVHGLDVVNKAFIFRIYKI